MVKNFIKSGNTEGLLKSHPVYGTVSKPFSEPVKNPIQPDVIEINKNPRARSAKLRVAEKNL
jgi:16S rRNA (cytosine1402-N4)-methyltransferase